MIVIVKAEQLLAFCTVARYKNITQAAEALGISQPGLSRQLASLHEAVNETLYERTAYGIELTAAGENFLPYACAVAQTLTQARDYVKNKSKHLNVELKIGISYSLVPNFLPKILSRLTQLQLDLPNLQVTFTEGYSEPLVERVLQRQLDAAFVIEPFSKPPQPLKSRMVQGGMIGLYALATHALAGQSLASIASLQSETLIVPSSISSVYKRVQACLTRNGVALSKTLEVSGPSAVLACVKSGLGLGIGLWTYLQSEQTQGIQFIQIEERGFEVSSILVTHEQATLEPAKRDALSYLSQISDLT